MSPDDKAARKARAEEIRAKAKRGRPSRQAPKDGDESPRDFVARRMREVAEKKKPES